MDSITKQYADEPEKMEEQFDNLAEDYKTRYARQIKDVSQRKQLYKAVGNLIDTQVDKKAKQFGSEQRKSITTARKSFKREYRAKLEGVGEQESEQVSPVVSKESFGEGGFKQDKGLEAVEYTPLTLTTSAVLDFIVGSGW